MGEGGGKKTAARSAPHSCELLLQPVPYEVPLLVRGLVRDEYSIEAAIKKIFDVDTSAEREEDTAAFWCE